MKHLLILAAVATAVACADAQTADELLERGREAYLDYNFSEARQLYTQAKRKARKAGAEFEDRYSTYNRQLSNAENFLERVEKIVIIDSITVPRNEFFKAYRLPHSAGTLRGAEALPYPSPDVSYVYSSENDDYKVWAETDTTGYSHLVESTLLTDGSWSTPTPLSEELSEECDAVFPFMMADGVTLYYADNGENSIGGYDIMIATRDAADGTFLQPQNLGFPYNSPYDDYLLAIDELNGVGWWATDRNQLDDELTVYVFIPNEMRVNYPADGNDLISFARISDYIATQPEDGNYDELLAAIRAINPEKERRKREFILHGKGGKIYTDFESMPSIEARETMRQYLKESKSVKKQEEELGALRRKYHDAGGERSLVPKIRDLEQELEKSRAHLAKTRSALYKLL